MGVDNPNVLRDEISAVRQWGSGQLGELLADDIVWHTPGRNPLSGDYRGKDAVLALFGLLAEEARGTLRADVHDLLTTDDHGIGLVTATARGGDHRLAVKDTNVFHLRDGQVTECWIASSDQRQKTSSGPELGGRDQVRVVAVFTRDQDIGTWLLDRQIADHSML
jgi:uncharacterized protein